MGAFLSQPDFILFGEESFALAKTGVFNLSVLPSPWQGHASPWQRPSLRQRAASPWQTQESCVQDVTSLPQ